MLNAPGEPILRAFPRARLRIVRRTPARFGGIGWLAIAVMVLVPLLAVLQYRWLGQLSEGDHERRQRTLTTAIQQFALEVDDELGRALASLSVDAPTLENEAWDTVGQRYQAWAASAVTPDLLDALFLATTTREALTLRVWDPTTHRFEPAAWPPEMDALRARLEGHARQHAGNRGGGGGRDRLTPMQALGDEGTLVSPIMRVSMPDFSDGRLTPPDFTLLGFTIVRLDLDVLRNQVLPAVVRRHLYDTGGTTEYRVAIIDRDEPSRVIFESEAGAAEAVRARHDASVDFLSARGSAFRFVGRTGPGGGPPPPPDARDRAVAVATDRVVVNMIEATRDGTTTTVQTRMIAGREGHWRLLVAHQAGSLDAAVAAARLRNLLLSSGILLLLTVAIGLIVGSARRAQALARQQIEFVAAVSHELRTPVAVIGSAAANLADGVVGDPGRVRTYGKTIQSEARRLGETVERVLQLAGLEAGRAGNEGAVSVEALVRDAIAACALDVARHGATVETDVAPDLPAVAGDAGTLGSALQNLLGNAMKYGADAPWVKVSARPGARAGEVAITVEDRGLGIAAEDRPHVFEPFYRGREAVSRQIQGSGLGLSLVKRIADAHGGRVELASEPGRGSRFTLHLRVASRTRTGDVTMSATAPVAHGSR
jgi:signal transduction histidine kinase